MAIDAVNSALASARKWQVVAKDEGDNLPDDHESK
jgi:hypothetical protein